MSRIDFAPAQTTANSGPRKLHQVGGNVEGLHGAAMDAADAARGEDFDARQLGEEHRRRNRGAGRAAPRGDRGEIPPRGFHHAARKLAEAFDLPGFEADAEPPVDDGDGRRRGAEGAHRILDHARRLDIARIGHAVGDDGRFERDDGPSARPRLGDFGREIHQIGGAHTIGSLAAAIGSARDYRESAAKDQWRAASVNRFGVELSAMARPSLELDRRMG